MEIKDEAIVAALSVQRERVHIASIFTGRDDMAAILKAAFAAQFGGEEAPRYTTRRLHLEIQRAIERGRELERQAAASPPSSSGLTRGSAEAAAPQTHVVVKQAFLDGLNYATTCKVTDPEEAWRTSSARARLEHDGTPAPPGTCGGIALTLTRALGPYGSAYDPIGVPLRAYTYEHQPGNGVAWNLGCAVSALRQHPSAGDPIDVGLYLLKEMQARGLGVFEVEPKAVEPTPEKHVDRDRLIGNLLDRWEMTPNDLKEEMREHGCGKQLDALMQDPSPQRREEGQ